MDGSRRLRRLQLLALAAASSLLLVLLAVHATTPTSTDPHEVSVHGPRRLLGDDAKAVTPAPSSPTEEDGVGHRLYIFVVCLLAAFLIVLLVKVVGCFAAYVAHRCASAWRSVKGAREKATHVRPLDAAAAGV